MTEKLIGTTIDSRYVVESLIGKGGMGAVYRAHDKKLNRNVALKVPHSQLLVDNQFRERFIREAQVVHRFEHPAIVPVYHFNNYHDFPYLVMPYLAGGSLHERLSNGPLPLEKMIPTIDGIALALRAMHQAGVVHRTVRPRDILFDLEGNAYLSDFGVVTWIDEKDPLEAAGTIIGVPAYMSPEQLLGKPVDGRSDIYALGITCIELMAGEFADHPGMPFFPRTLEERIKTPPAALDLRELIPELSESIFQVLQQVIAEDPIDRYHDAVVFAEDLKSAIELGDDYSPRPPTTTSSQSDLALAISKKELAVNTAGKLPMQSIANYEIQGLFGTRSLTEEFIATEPTLNRNVLLSILHSQLSYESDFIRRFKLAASSMAQLEHPTIVPIYDSGDSDGYYYTVTRFMPGGSLRDLITSKSQLEWSLVIPIIERIALALNFAHQNHVIHRDIKPDVILFDAYGQAHLSGFGIIKLTESEYTFTGTGNFFGTPAYMSPEQVRDEPLDGRSDVYSLGVVLFEMITGQKPFQDVEPLKIALAHITEPVPNASKWRPDCPDHVQSIIELALTKHPGERYQTPLELAADLRSAIESPDSFVLKRPLPVKETVYEKEPQLGPLPVDEAVLVDERDIDVDMAQYPTQIPGRASKYIRLRLSPGDTLDNRYQLLDILGQGGSATVFLAKDPQFGREVSIKVLKSDSPSFEAQQSFQFGAKVAASIEHSAVVPVYDLGKHDGLLYLVMRYMQAGTLADRISKEPLAIEEILPIVDRIASALNTIHQLGIAHRDVKPGNIVFDRFGDAYLSDFGLSWIHEDVPKDDKDENRRLRGILSSLKPLSLAGGIQSVNLTVTGRLLGTPAFMSPEQAENKTIDGRSDIYSLGVTIFQMLTGHLPFTADQPLAIVVAHIHNPVPDVRKWRPDLPDAVQLVVERAMAKDPEDRYQHASELAMALRHAILSPQSFPLG